MREFLKGLFSGSERKMTHKEEVRRALIKAVALAPVLGLTKGIPSQAQQELPPTSESTPEVALPTTEREAQGFVFPEDIHGNESFWGKDVLITIDDCVSLEDTRKMYEALHQRGLKGTFFPNTNYLSLDDEQTVSLWRQMYQDGFEIGYHTTNHEVTEYNKEQLSADLNLFEAHMRSLLQDESFTIKFARPPYGNWNDSWMDFVRERNLSNVRWNFVPNAQQNSIDYFRAVANHPDGGRIVLLHPRTFDATWLENNVSELQIFAESEGGRVSTLTGNPA